MALTLITPPTSQVVTTTEAKSFLRIDHSDDDTLIDLLIEAATKHLDGRNGTLQRALNPQTWELSYDSFPCGSIEIPLPPLTEVLSVKYDDSNGDEQTIASTNYYVDIASEPGWVVPVSTFIWPTPLVAANAVRIRFTAGYAEESGSSGVPETIKTAIKMMVADLYDYRESITPQSVNQITIPTTVERLVNQYKVHAFA